MDLKIGAVQAAGVSRYNNVMKKTQTAGVAKQESDKVDISESSRLFQAALKSAKEAPETRDGMVGEIKQRVDNGTYQVSARQIAEKMLSSIR